MRLTGQYTLLDTRVTVETSPGIWEWFSVDAIPILDGSELGGSPCGSCGVVPVPGGVAVPVGAPAPAGDCPLGAAVEVFAFAETFGSQRLGSLEPSGQTDLSYRGAPMFWLIPGWFGPSQETQGSI